MKKIFFVLCIGMILIAPAAFADESKAKEITIHEYMFVPKELSVAVGTKVTWINHDEVPHTIVENSKQFRSSALDTDDRFSYIFTKPGVYHYFCTLHPQMVGTITVTASP